MKETGKNAFRFGFAFVVVLVLAAGIAVGSAAADHGEPAGMDGEGTEDDPYVITDVHELQAMNEDREAHYVLGNDIDASETEQWEAGAGFTPIGEERDDNWFSGSFDGRGHTIDGLQIHRPRTTHVGLFGYTYESTIENVHLEDVSVTGGQESGALVGYNIGTVRGVSVSGQVRGTDETLGGVVGYNSGELSRTSFDGTVGSTDETVGGLVGINSGPIDFSYTVATVEGDEYVGGFVGINSGPIRSSFATGDATGENTIGGLVGSNSDALNDVYSTANVSGGEVAGGLIGSNSGTITTAYATGTVNGSEGDAALMASNSGIVNTAYWNTQTSGHSEAYHNDYSDESGAVGLESDELTGEDAVQTTELDFDSEWVTSDAYPRLQWESDRDVPEDAYDVITEPVDLDGSEEAEEGTEAENESSEPSTDQQRDDVFGIPGFGVVPAAIALLAVALIGYRKRYRSD